MMKLYFHVSNMGMWIIRKFNQIPYLRVKFGIIKSFKQYCELSNRANFVVLSRQIETKVYPIKYTDEGKKNCVICMQLEQYIAELFDAFVIGSSNAIISREGVVCFDLLANRKKEYRIYDCGLFCLYGKVVVLKSVVMSRFLYNGEVEDAICLSGNFSFNYYHFIYEFIIKFYLIEKMNIPKHVPIIVDCNVKQYKQFLDILQLFAKGRTFIFLESKRALKVHHLYYPSFVNHIPPDFEDIRLCTNGDIVFSFDALDYLRDSLLKLLPTIAVDMPANFMISRRNALRRKYNEGEIVQISLKYGFTIVCPEELSFIDQVKLFANAKHIIAASGAALTNIICCNSSCKILALVSEKLDLPIFSTIAEHFQIEMVYLSGDAKTKNAQSGFNIDKDLFEQALTKLML